MKIKNIIFSLVFLFFIILLPSMIFFVSNFTFGNNFIFSNNINKNLEKVFEDNDLLNIKKADYYYKMGEYDKAFKKYSEVDCKTKELCFILNHNIGNTYYKMGENLNNLDKLNLWQKSLSYYLKALDIKFDQKSKNNYDFVLDKVNNLTEEIKKQNEPKQETDKEQKEEQKQSKPDSQKEENITPKGPSIQIDNDKTKAQKPLTEDEKKSVEKYIESLKQEEKQNIEFSKPQESIDIYDILEKDFFSGFDRNENDW